MGKGGRGNKKASAPTRDDDALLEQAIAENQRTLEKVALDKEQAKRAQVTKEVGIARRDQEGAALSKEEIVAKLDALPAFCVVDAKKQFVPLSVHKGGSVTDGVTTFWTEPLEAKDALAQAIHQRPDANLALGTIPLGRAFALCEGWAEAAGATSFRLHAHSKVSLELRPMLTKQLDQQGLPTEHVFPIFMCEELSTETQMPLFLSRVEMVATWEAAMQKAGLTRPPPEKMTVMDLRILVKRMQAGGMDWSIFNFIGTDRAYETVREGQRQEEERPPPLLGDEPPPLQ